MDLLELLTNYIAGTIDEIDKVKLYRLVIELNLRLTNRHYRKFQFISDYRTDEKQRIRTDLFIEFVHENKHRTANWILSSYQRRFPWFEFLVGCRYYGINIFDESKSLSKSVNSKRVSDMVKNLALFRKFVTAYGREPDPKEFAILLIKQKLLSGKLVMFSSIQRMAYDTLTYMYCLRYSNPLIGFDETKRQEPGL